MNMRSGRKESEKKKCPFHSLQFGDRFLLNRVSIRLSQELETQNR